MLIKTIKISNIYWTNVYLCIYRNVPKQLKIGNDKFKNYLPMMIPLWMTSTRYIFFCLQQLTCFLYFQFPVKGKRGNKTVPREDVVLVTEMLDLFLVFENVIDNFLILIDCKHFADCAT